MFSVKGFAAGKNVTPSSGSAGAAIMANSIAVSIAAPKPAVSSVELQTFATEKLWKEGSINETDSELIASVVQHFPLWIKVPRSHRMLAASSRRYFACRFLPEIVANNMSLECRIALSAVGRAGL
jgi:hypothetical protein